MDRIERDNTDEETRIEEESGSVMERVARRLHSKGEISGKIKVPYAGFATVFCAFKIRIKSSDPSNPFAEINMTIEGPYGEENERIEFDVRNGQLGNFSTHEPAEIDKRYVAVLYHAAGLQHLVSLD